MSITKESELAGMKKVSEVVATTLKEMRNYARPSHGPATLQDFAWWSGLSVTDAKNALNMIKSRFMAEKINEQTYWLPDSFSLPDTGEPTVYLLPAFDEFIISYKDRSPSLAFRDHSKAVSNNGIFWSVIVINGQVAGIWKRTLKKDKIIIETDFFARHTTPKWSPDKATKHLIEKASAAFGHFLNRNVEII